MKTYLSAIETAVPDHQIPQQDIAEFMIKAHALDAEESRKLKFIYRASGIQSRHSVIPDYGTSPDRFSFYPANDLLDPFPNVKNRMQLFEKEAPLLMQKAVGKVLQQLPAQAITHLITVSCTGMYAPGLDFDLMQHFGISGSVERYAINFMGCYAVFNALKLAHHICQSNPTANVLIADVELCTLHFQKDYTEDNLIANALFADGAAAVLVQGEQSVYLKEPLFTIEKFACSQSPKGADAMAWHIGDFGFEMKLSSYVPQLVGEGIPDLVDALLKNGEQLQADHYAIHPGGKKILEAIEKALSISAAANQTSYDVLSQYGNMSSVTVLFVLKALAEKLTDTPADQNVLSMAFGPGLTLESMLLKTT